MSGSLVGNTIRADVSNQDFTVPYDAQLTSDGSQGSVNGSIASNTNLVIDLPSSGTATSLSLGGSFSFIENENDTGAVAINGTDANTPVIVYEGDTSGQTFYAGTGTEYAAFAGFGNLFVAPTVAGGTYEISAGLVGGNPGSFDAVDLAAAPAAGSAQLGNTIVAGGGNASISAGLGDNTIFLGTGTGLVASEGQDNIIAGGGDATVDGAGAATVFAGTGTLNFYGDGGKGLIVGTDSASGAINVTGGNGTVTVFGGAGTLTATGGVNGNNVLVAGAGNATLFGGGSGDVLVASNTGTTTLVAAAASNETLYGSSGSGSANFFLGAGVDSVIGGSGSEYVQFGSGSSTVFSGTGSDVYGLVNGAGGTTDLIVGFNSASDFLELQGFGSASGASGLADVSVSGGNSYIQGSTDAATIELYGVTNLTAANFI